MLVRQSARRERQRSPRPQGPIALRLWFDRRVRAAVRMADLISTFDQPDDDH
jgi:hypothetical protein